jgi:hypothetical protein
MNSVNRASPCGRCWALPKHPLALMPGAVSPWVGVPLPHQAGTPGGTASPIARRALAASLLPPAAARFKQCDPPRDILHQVDDASNPLRGGRPDARGSGGGGRAPPLLTLTIWLASLSAVATLHAGLWPFQSARWHSGEQ